MHVLLINPNYPLTEIPSPPLGLAFVAGAFEQAGATVRVLDLVVEPYSIERLQQLLEDFQPDLVGATCVTMTFDAAIKVLADVKKLSPQATTIMGGPHITFCAHDMLQQYPQLDLAALGEGEVMAAELVEVFQGQRSLASVPGLVYREDDKLKNTAENPPVVDVDLLPLPARHLLPLGRYRALGLAISMVTSRGCPFKCIFCVGRQMSGSKVRYRNPMDVVDEMEFLGSLGFSQINIADDLFTAKKKHCFAICDEIIRRGLKLKWTAFSRANTISPELLKKIKAAGCVQLSFGFESANEEILKTVEKRITKDIMIRAVEMCRDAGMSAQASFISGLPGETEETLRETEEFAYKINEMGTTFGIHILAPFPGTGVRDDAESHGIKINSNNWSEYTADTAIIETKDADAAMLERSAFKLYEQAKQNFEAVSERVSNGSASDEEKQNFDILERMSVYYDLMMAGVFEKPGGYPVSGGAADSKKILNELVFTASRYLTHSVDIIKKAIFYGFDKNFFSYSLSDGQVVWQWCDPVLMLQTAGQVEKKEEFYILQD